MKIQATVLLFGLATLSAFAAERTVSLSVPDMDCPVCPITVRKALEKVPGVQRVSVDFAARSVLVTFEDHVATPERLTRGTADAGYPSVVVGETK